MPVGIPKERQNARVCTDQMSLAEGLHLVANKPVARLSAVSHIENSNDVLTTFRAGVQNRDEIETVRTIAFDDLRQRLIGTHVLKAARPVAIRRTGRLSWKTESPSWGSSPNAPVLHEGVIVIGIGPLKEALCPVRN